MKYDFAQIEKRHQARWDQHKTFATPGPPPGPGDADFDPHKPKYYVLAMFPYPSGAGMHMGHALNYTSTDIVARYKKMAGFNVLHPIGFDAFGLPAEQYAVEKGVHPRITTQQNIDNIAAQFKALGIGFDWDRCLSTTDVDYYKWTQWIFLKLYNSYIEPVSKKARPIGELINQLEALELYVGISGELVEPPAVGLDGLEGVPVGARKWHELDSRQQEAVLAEQRLAYLDEVPVNWCPGLGTVLANEEVTNEGRSERGNFPVFKRPLRQWMLRITAMADRLNDDLDHVKWPESIKIMQRNWIGRSEGAEVHFPLAYGTAESDEDIITVFTTRPDTLFGATYMVLAPEHPLVDAITTSAQREAVETYRSQAEAKTDIDRQADAKEKTGVFTGGYALNPANDKTIPIWIADYVMMGYAAGAIMAVPAHDQRDHDFARTFDLPITQVVSSDHAIDINDQAWEGRGRGMNSTNDEVSLNDLDTADAKHAMIQWLQKRELGRGAIQYKLRDWLFSRQRYWGEPFPILHGPDDQIVALSQADLPVVLPELEDFKPQSSDDPGAPPRPPLGRAPAAWKSVELDGETFSRELNTMPQWAGSCWYYLRFLDPHNDKRFVGRVAEKYWMLSKKADGTVHAGGVDLYVGGVEHAVLHLLYARFWHKVLYDLGEVSTSEPFGRLFNQGYIQAPFYEDDRGMRVPADEIIPKDGAYFYQGSEVKRLMGKMGKSLKNAVSPDEVIEQYGCDTLRLFLMYLGPLDQSKPWNPKDIVGVHRFLQRLWRNLVDEETGQVLVNENQPDEALERKLHKTIKRVTDDMERLGFNTAIAALIELNNALVQLDTLPRSIAEPLVSMLCPLAPHIAEELWQKLGHEQSLALAPWPVYDEAMLVEDEIELPVQVNGKMRGKITVPADADDPTIKAAAIADDKVAAAISGKTISKFIIVKGRLINLVTK